MAVETDRRTRRRTPVTRERVVRAAIKLADKGGLDAVSMRRLGEALRVEAMSLYKHVANKDAILDAVVDTVFGEIGLPAGAAIFMAIIMLTGTAWGFRTGEWRDTRRSTRRIMFGGLSFLILAIAVIGVGNYLSNP